MTYIRNQVWISLNTSKPASCILYLEKKHLLKKSKNNPAVLIQNHETSSFISIKKHPNSYTRNQTRSAFQNDGTGTCILLLRIKQADRLNPGLAETFAFGIHRNIVVHLVAIQYFFYIPDRFNTTLISVSRILMIPALHHPE